MAVAGESRAALAIRLAATDRRTCIIHCKGLAKSPIRFFRPTYFDIFYGTPDEEHFALN